MSQKNKLPQISAICSAHIGSHTLAIKAQRALEQYKIQSSVSKTTTNSGCVYVVNFPCVYRENAENVLSSVGIKIKGYL